MELTKRIEKVIERLDSLINNFDQMKFERMNMSITQIRKILYELEQMKKIMNPQIFFPTYAHMIVDSWDTNEEEELSDELLNIKNIYNRIKVRPANSTEFYKSHSKNLETHKEEKEDRSGKERRERK